ncbi:Protein NRT1/ PTR family 5.10 [Vitis vinifera]|uniref:Protein NRT1/ PTR family 5.10 n=1 Tax=Vitis vinifera TaxID=29760 RepID=A0A438FG89_VITVI|nr:Protein NRT1/ PTR family 5.10 [Vitis vinifera]
MRKYPSGCVLAETKPWLELPEAPDLRCWKTQFDGSIDYKGRPAKRPTSGGWRSAYFIMVQSYKLLHGPTGTVHTHCCESVNTWTGTGSLMPLVGAFVADSYLGRYATIINASLLYILGLVLLTLSAVFPALSPSNCPKRNKTISTYRSSVKGHERDPFMRIGQVFIAAAKNWLATPSSMATEDLAGGTLQHLSALFLNKALLAQDGSKGNGRQCTIDDVEEAKAILRSIGSGFDIPAASLQAFIGLSIVLTIPIYDRIFVPIARTLTRNPSGITMLQRIGTGMFLSAISMVIAARTWLG